MTRAPLPPLLPEGPWRPEWRQAIDALELPSAARAVLHLWNDDLEASHELAQTGGDPSLHYCHAILHRREADYGNSSYWYARVTGHPVLAAMRALHPGWTADSFLESVSHLGEKGSGEEERLRKSQADEMRLLWEAVS